MRVANDMPACRLVVFDLFGTTVADDGSVDAAFGAVLDAQAIPYDTDVLAGVRGFAKRDALKTITDGHAGVDVEVLYAAFKDALGARWASRPLRAAEGALETIAAVHAAGVRAAITTGLDRDLADAIVDAVQLRVGGLAVVCAEDVAHGRPAPDLIHRAMALTGITDARAVACVGDTAADLAAGAAAGVRWNLGVLGGAHDEGRLRRAPHTTIIRSLRELPGAIGFAPSVR